MNSIKIQKIGITDLDTDAIVNAANEGLWAGGGDNKEPQMLYGAYRRSLELALENGCHSIGFPLISAGIFGYPKDKAWRKAIQACNDFFQKNSDADLQVVFAVLDDGILSLGQQTLEEIAPQYGVKNTI